ncbi:hypothetical protein TNCV_3057491 [Trichonephila clavipes]|nr:hypothetical protein TNCV_3057491 [Trichonephila clavipes]
MKILKILCKVYGESTMAKSKVYEWHRCFKEGRESIEDNERFGRLSTLQNAENVALVPESNRKDQIQTLAQLAEATHFLKMFFEEMHSS